MDKVAYLGLGSNLGDRLALLQRSLEELSGEGLRVLRVSPVYETEPVDVLNQPAFLNAVAEVETRLFPLMLLARARRVEKALGRRRVIAKGPRTIDIDILLYGGFTMESPELTVPHPRMLERRFVLKPLADLAPELRHPAARRTIRELLDAAPPQGVRQTGMRLNAPGS